MRAVRAASATRHNTTPIMDIASMPWSIVYTHDNKQIELLKVSYLAQEHSCKEAGVKLHLGVDMKVTDTKGDSAILTKQSIQGKLAVAISDLLRERGMEIPTTPKEPLLTADYIRYFFSSHGKILYAERMTKEITMPSRNHAWNLKTWTLSATSALRRAIQSGRPDIATRIIINNNITNKRRWFALVSKIYTHWLLPKKERDEVVAWSKGVLQSPKAQSLVLMNQGKDFLKKIKTLFCDDVLAAEPESSLMFLANTALMDDADAGLTK